MNTINLCSTQYLDLDENFKQFSFYTNSLVKKNQKVLDGLLDKTLIKIIGEIAVKEFEKPFFCSSAEVLDNEDVRERNDCELGDMQLFLFCLWFIKDNSVNVINNYTYLPSKGGAFFTNKTTVYSNCEGCYLDTKFSQEEIEQAFHYHQRVTSISVNLHLNPVGTGPSEFGLIRPGGLESILYNTTNKIEKTLIYLQIARSNSFLPLKISFYVAIFEALFTTDKDELSHKISERTALYLKGTKDEKKEVFRIVKSAYDVRSKFLHGQSLTNKNKKLDQLIKISLDVDNLLRRLLKIIIFEDSQLFLSAKFDQHIEDLIFE